MEKFATLLNEKKLRPPSMQVSQLQKSEKRLSVDIEFA
jgi:hypothetical protein